MVQKKDIYYIITIIFTVCFFGVFIFPQVTRILLFYELALWLIILIVCIALPLFAILILWLIIYEIQQQFKEPELSDEEVEKSHLIEEVFTEDDEKFIEEKMREQLDKFQFEDEDIYEVHTDLILTYVIHRAKIDKKIPLVDISKAVEIPIEVVKDILLVLIADGLIECMIKDEILECST